jgi:hypothetical protein
MNTVVTCEISVNYKDSMNRAPSPLKTFLICWGCLFAVLASGLIVYEDIDLYSGGILYLLFGISAFSFGYILACRYGTSTSEAASDKTLNMIQWRDEAARYSNVITISAYCGIFAAVLFAFEMIFIHGVNIYDIGDIRSAFLGRTATVYSQVAIILGAGGFISLVSAILCWSNISNAKRFLWLLSPIFMTLFSVLSGGRQTVLQLILFIFFSLRLRNKLFTVSRKYSIIVKATFAVVLILVIGYGMLAAYQRNEQAAVITKKEMVLGLLRAHLNPKVDTIIDSLPEVLRDGTAELILYFTHSVPMFLVFWDLEKPGPYWGLWEFNFIARRLDSLGLTTENEESRIDNVYSSFAVSGRFPQVWQTQMRDMIIDFTPFGAIIGLLLLGFIAGRLFKTYEQNGGLVLALLVVVLNIVCFYSIIISIISDTLIFFYFLVCFALLFINAAEKKRDHSAINSVKL